MFFPTALFFFLRKRKASGGKEKEEGIAMQSLKKRKENGNLPLANCLSQLLRNWLFLFLEPQELLSLPKRKKWLDGKLILLYILLLSYDSETQGHEGFRS